MTERGTEVDDTQPRWLRVLIVGLIVVQVPVLAVMIWIAPSDVGRWGFATTGLLALLAAFLSGGRPGAWLRRRLRIRLGLAVLAGAPAARNCVYGLVGDRHEVIAALQLDLSLFTSEDQFREAWEDDAEILDRPGLASSHTTAAAGQRRSVTVLLNHHGDAFTLEVSGWSTTRERFLADAAALAARYRR